MNLKTRYSMTILFVAFLGICSAYLFDLDAVPRSFGDESWYSVPTVELITKGILRNHVIPGRGGQEHYYLQPKIALNLLALPFVQTLGVNLLSFRLTSVVTGMFGLIGTYLLARILYSPFIALLGAVFTATNWWFFATARTFRPEIFVLTFSVWYLVLLLYSLHKRSWLLGFWCGISAGLALLSHQMSVLILLALSLSVFCILRFEDVGGFWGIPPRASLRQIIETFVPVLLGLLLGVAVLAIPYGLYVISAEKTQLVSWIQQLTGEARGMDAFSLVGLVKKEADRWSNFLQHFIGDARQRYNEGVRTVIDQHQRVIVAQPGQLPIRCEQRRTDARRWRLIQITSAAFSGPVEVC